MFRTKRKFAGFAVLTLAVFAVAVDEGWGVSKLAKGPQFGGKVITISEDGKSITVESGGSAKGAKSKRNGFKLADETKLVWTGLFPDVGTKLKLGDHVHVVPQEGATGIAAEVQAEHSPDGVGTIAAVSGDGKMLTVEFSGATTLKGKTVITLNEKTKLVFGSGEARLRVGYPASVWLAEGSKDTAFGVHISQPRNDASGIVTAVSADGKVLTLEVKVPKSASKQVSVKITEETKITFVGYPVKDKTIKTGYQVSAWFKEGSTDTAVVLEANMLKRGPDLNGKISAVSADGKTVTLETRKVNADPAVFVEIKLTEKTDINFRGFDKDAEKKLTVGCRAAVWLLEGMKNTAEGVIVVKAVEPGP